MTNPNKDTWDGQFEDAVKWVRSLPLKIRLTRIPIIGKYLFRDTVIGDPSWKAWMVPVHEDIRQPDNVHLPLDVLRPIVEKASHIGRVKECMCRKAFECETYPHDLACLFFGEAAAKSEKHGLIRLSTEEAIAHIEHAVGLGLVPTIIYEKEIQTILEAPEEKGLALCLCCDCCCDVRLSLRMAGEDFRKKVIRPEGVSVVVSDDCQLCGDCTEPEVCSVSAITLGSSKSEIDLEVCVGCGHCIQICPNEAISFEVDPEANIVGKLIAQVEAVTDVT